MKCAVSKCFLISILLANCGLISASEACKCPKNPGPGGGVQCSKDQIATCDPSSGECNCTCDFVQKGKSKEEYEALILSKVLHDKVNSSDLSSPQYGRFLVYFRNSEDGTFKFEKEVGNGQSTPVKVGVPDWLKEILSKPSGSSVGPRGFLQNCPNGGCVGSYGGVAGNTDQSGTGNVSQIGNGNTQITVESKITPEQREQQRNVE
jgi:hypothetical protein